MVRLAVVVVVVAVVGDKLVVCDVDCECSECNAEAGERALEAAAAAEGAGVPPGLAVWCQSVCGFHVALRRSHSRGWCWVQTYALAQGSFAGWPAAAANFWGSKPVRLGRGAIVMSVECQGARPGMCVSGRRRTDCVNVLNGAQSSGTC